jgi:hypothetical protein
MKKLLVALLLSPVIAVADPVTITFNNKLPITKSSDLTKPGCQTSTQGYFFNVTMAGWNSPSSTCTATNLFSNPGYVTAGQRAPRGSAQTWISPINGSTFSFAGFKIKNYSSTNTLYVDTFSADGSVYTTVIPATMTSVTFEPTAVEFSNLTSVSIHSTNNRFDVTNVMVQ